MSTLEEQKPVEPVFNRSSLPGPFVRFHNVDTTMHGNAFTQNIAWHEKLSPFSSLCCFCALWKRKHLASTLNFMNRKVQTCWEPSKSVGVRICFCICATCAVQIL